MSYCHAPVGIPGVPRDRAGSRYGRHLRKRNAAFAGVQDRRLRVDALNAQQCRCTKIGYTSKRAAKLALRAVSAVRRHRGDLHRERSIYRCDRCGLYHLTSWPARWRLHPQTVLAAADPRPLRPVLERS